MKPQLGLMSPLTIFLTSFQGTYACLSLQAEHLPSIARSHSPLQPKAQCSRRVTASDVSGIVDGDHVLWHIITIKVLS